MILRGRRVSTEAIVVAASLVVLVAVSFLHEQPGSEQLDTFASTDYRSGGYAAWAALLRREGIATTAFDRRPSDLDGSIDTLIVAYPPGPFERTQAEAAALGDWVRAGGRAIVLGATPSLTPLERERLGRPRFARAGGGGPLTGRFAPEIGTLAGLGRGPRATRFAVASTAELLADDGGAIAARVPLGAGEIVYVIRAGFFANRTIARGDNARLAYLLGRPRRAGGIVAFDEALHGTIVDRRWWGVLGIPDRIAFVGLVLAIGLALAGAALRLGPAIRLQPAREPTSSEFIEALAALYARTHARNHALALLGMASSGQLDDAQLLAGARAAHALREARR